MFKRFFICVIIVFSFGCASMSNGSHQSVSIGTTNDKFTELTICKLSNEEGEWDTKLRKPVEIYRDGNPLLVICSNSEQTGQSLVETEFEGELLVLDLLLDLCIISCVIDGASNAFYEYPMYIQVDMEKVLIIE